MKATKDDIKRWSVDNRNSNRKSVEDFFDLLHDSVGIYSPMLSTAVLYCEWKAGIEIVDVTYEVVFITPDELLAHVGWLEENYGEDTPWTCDLLASFDHITLPLDEDRYIDEAVALLSTIGVAPDWTNSPVKGEDVTIYHTNGECPECGEPFNLDGDMVDFDCDKRGPYAYQRVHCGECGCEFVDIYRLERTEVWR